jgi:anti-sigma factor RsiW
VDRHPGPDLIACRRGELGPDDRARVERHLATCPACRETLASDKALLTALAAARPGPPPVDWRRYRATLRARVARRRGWRGWLGWPGLAPLALSVTVAAAAVALVLQPPARPPVSPPVLATVPEPTADDVELLRNYAVVERLDLLEDLDVVRHLDRLLASGEG